MKTLMIVGLGNPEFQYFESPHNCGFRVIDALVQDIYKGGETLRISNQKTYWVGTYLYKSNKVLLVKPLRYMNLSGTGIYEVIQDLKLKDLDSSKDMLVIHDELDIEAGQIKVVESGNPGNNNGCKNVNEVLGLNGKWNRIKVGAKPIGPITDKIAYVINKMSTEQSTEVTKGERKAKQAALKWLELGIEKTMTECNRKGLVDESSTQEVSASLLCDGNVSS